MTKDTTQIASILYAALDKYQAGAKKYGPYDPETDQRDMLQEAEEEILDAINYLAMLLVKIRAAGKGKLFDKPGKG